MQSVSFSILKSLRNRRNLVQNFLINWLSVNCWQGFGYEWFRDLALNFTSTHQTENPSGFSEVHENKQLPIAIVGVSFLYRYFSYSVR